MPPVYIISLLLLIFSTQALAQTPLISSVSGNVADNSVVTIEGSGFGSQGPQIVIFDDFESGTALHEIRTGAGSAAIGQWRALGGTHPLYTSDYKVSGSLAFQADMTNLWLAYSEVQLPLGTQELFLSYWRFIPPGDNLPGEGSSVINWKVVWVRGDGLLTNGTYVDGSSDDDIWVPGHAGSSLVLAGNDLAYAGWPGGSFSKGQWKRVWAWLRNGLNNDGNVHYWELAQSGPQQLLNDNNTALLKQPTDGISPGPARFDNIHLNGFGNQALNSHPTFDDFYVAAGENARARIEIGNNPTYANCTKLTLATAVSWGSNQIQATVRQGMFAAGETAYIFVINSTGAINATGAMVTFAATGDSVAPAAPSLLRVQ